MSSPGPNPHHVETFTIPTGSVVLSGEFIQGTVSVPGDMNDYVGQDGYTIAVGAERIGYSGSYTFDGIYVLTYTNLTAC